MNVPHRQVWMKRTRLARTALAALLALAPLGCSHQVIAPFVPNQRPTVRLTQYPSVANGRYGYTYTMKWMGFDPDGEVRAFRYVVDPPPPTPFDPDPDTSWTTTTDYAASFTFTASIPESAVAGAPARASEYHVFVIEAVDNRGLASLPTVSAFNAETIAPTVSFVSPAPNGPARVYVPLSFDAKWVGNDPDGTTSHNPIFYRTILLTTSSEVTPVLAMTYPDTLRHLYQPRGWAGWDSVGSNVNSKHLSELVPEQEYAFCVVAFDEAGAYTPVVSNTSNLLFFRPRFAQANGPRLTIFSDFFLYTYKVSTYLPNDPTQQITLEVPANSPTTVQWFAAFEAGTSASYYRWVLDPDDLQDNTPRSNERTDLHHWSAASPLSLSASLPAFGAAGIHHLYVEVSDLNGLKSLGHVVFRSIVPSFQRTLAIVDDTRLLLDQIAFGTGCVGQPLGRWPTAAELDTFLYARGGVPIKCYPAGSVSRPGVFTGYDFDTLNTRTGSPVINVPLSTLAGYTHVLWLTDALGAINTAPGNNLAEASTAMRYMNSSGHANTLASYMRMGGEVWLAGGGVALASLLPWNVTSNDRGRKTFSSAAGELAPGRFVWDFVHWRSEVQATSGALQITRSLGRFGSAPGPYAAFPAQLQLKSVTAGDSMPAWRTNPNEFYLTFTDGEGVTVPNPILEDQDPSPLVEDLQSALDTVYVASNAGLSSSPIMTVYHGRDNARVIMTGFNLWSFRRTQIVQLVDAVLQGLWGMTRNPAPLSVAPGASFGGAPPGAALSAPPGRTPGPAPWKPARYSDASRRRSASR